MPSTAAAPRASLLAVLSVALCVAVPLHAQTGGDATMAFPREMLASFLAGDADKVWERAGPTLREMNGSAKQMRDHSAELRKDMGKEIALISEQAFDHQDGNGAKVYVRAARHEVIPELFWIVIYTPSNRQVEMITMQPRQTIRTLFPQVKLP